MAVDDDENGSIRRADAAPSQATAFQEDDDARKNLANWQHRVPSSAFVFCAERSRAEPLNQLMNVYDALTVIFEGFAVLRVRAALARLR